DIFGENPAQVLDYFQIDLLRSASTKEIEYLGTLLPDELKNVVSSGINQESSIFVKNTGDTAIEVSLSDNPNTMNPDAMQTLQPNEEMTATGDEIPEMSAYFINMRNTSAVQEGSYRVIII